MCVVLGNFEDISEAICTLSYANFHLSACSIWMTRNHETLKHMIQVWKLEGSLLIWTGSSCSLNEKKILSLEIGYKYNYICNFSGFYLLSCKYYTPQFHIGCWHVADLESKTCFFYRGASVLHFCSRFFLRSKHLNKHISPWYGCPYYSQNTRSKVGPWKIY
jgi:hypothetical protein